MAYDHKGDLPVEYASDMIAWHLSDLERLEQAAGRARQNNWLNELGCRAISYTLHRRAGDFADNYILMGAELYAAITDTPNVGGDTVGTPTYRDPNGLRMVQEVTAGLDDIEGDDFEVYLYTQLWDVELNAPVLRDLLADIASTMTSYEQNREHIKMGAALLRSMHIDAAERLKRSAGSQDT